MTNLWLKLWMDGAAEMQRQYAHMMNEIVQQSLKIMSGVSVPPEPKLAKSLLLNHRPEQISATYGAHELAAGTICPETSLRPVIEQQAPKPSHLKPVEPVPRPASAKVRERTDMEKLLGL